MKVGRGWACREGGMMVWGWPRRGPGSRGRLTSQVYPSGGLPGAGTPSLGRPLARSDLQRRIKLGHRRCNRIERRT